MDRHESSDLREWMLRIESINKPSAADDVDQWMTPLISIIICEAICCLFDDDNMFIEWVHDKTSKTKEVPRKPQEISAFSSFPLPLQW